MPSDRVRKVDYWYVTMPDQPGAGAQVLSALAARKVTLTAFLAFPVGGGKAQIDLIPADAAAFQDAAKKAGLALSARKQALFVEGPTRPEALAEATGRLSARGLNVTAATSVATPGGGYGFVIWVRPQDLDVAASALST